MIFQPPLGLPSPKPARSGPNDAFVVKLNPTVPGPSGVIFATYLGGQFEDTGLGIAVDTNVNSTYAARPLRISRDRRRLSHHAPGNVDGFVARFVSPPICPSRQTSPQNSILIGGNLTYTIYVNNNGAPILSVSVTTSFRQTCSHFREHHAGSFTQTGQVTVCSSAF